MLETRLRRVAEMFWEAAGPERQFPCDIQSAIAWSVPLFILRVPNLWLHDVEEYLRRQQLPASIGSSDRPLHGCVVAMRGKGFIVVNGTVDQRELRFTIAHEVAHFILDYQQPRLQALGKFGLGIGEVLDGLRLPTHEERVDGLLAQAPIGLYTHFMHRDGRGGFSTAVFESESNADRLAFELVAPEKEVWRALSNDVLKRAYQQRLITVQRLLLRRFGLPSNAAQEYAARLCRSRFEGPSVREWLGIS